MNVLHAVGHWLFHQTPHKHLFAYRAVRDEEGNTRFYWKCEFFLCGMEFDDEDY